MYVYIVLFVIISVLGSSTAFFYNKLSESERQNAVLSSDMKHMEHEIADKIEEIQTCHDLRESDQQTILSITEESRKNEMEANIAIDNLEKAKEKKNVVLARPTLIQRMANSSTHDVFSEIQCVTGGKCDE